MRIKRTNLDGVFEIENRKFKDHRGYFVKTFHQACFLEMGLETDFKESFYSISSQGVLRGMHFQLTPHDHAKLVYVTNGIVLDVVVNIRKESNTFGEYYSTKLSSDNAKSLYIAKGFAHGFLTLSKSATVVYLTSTLYSAEHDAGIIWNSFSCKWGGIISPILSERDSNFPTLSTFINPRDI